MVKLLPLVFLAAFITIGCNPTVRIEAPKEPIRIEANIKIQHEIIVRVEKELDDWVGFDQFVGPFRIPRRVGT